MVLFDKLSSRNCFILNYHRLVHFSERSDKHGRRERIHEVIPGGTTKTKSNNSQCTNGRVHSTGEINGPEFPCQYIRQHGPRRCLRTDYAASVEFDSHSPATESTRRQLETEVRIDFCIIETFTLSRLLHSTAKIINL